MPHKTYTPYRLQLNGLTFFHQIHNHINFTGNFAPPIIATNGYSGASNTLPKYAISFSNKNPQRINPRIWITAIEAALGEPCRMHRKHRHLHRMPILRKVSALLPCIPCLLLLYRTARSPNKISPAAMPTKDWTSSPITSGARSSHRLISQSIHRRLEGEFHIFLFDDQWPSKPTIPLIKHMLDGRQGHNPRILSHHTRFYRHIKINTHQHASFDIQSFNASLFIVSISV